MTNNSSNKSSREQRLAPRVKRRRESYTFTVVAIILTSVLLASVALNVFLLSERESLPVHTSNDSNQSSDGTSDTTNENTTDSTTASTDESNTSMPDYVEEYEARIEECENEIASLREMIESYADAAQNNFDSQSAIFSSLANLLEIKNRPIHNHVKENEDDPEVKTPAEVGFAYIDLETGFTFGFNDEQIMYTASIIKAPFLYSVFREIEEFEYKKLNYSTDGEPLYDELGNPLFEGQHPSLDSEGNIVYLKGEEKYDLSREWVYDSKTMFVEGSGEIQKKKDGFTLTYLELAEYALKYSDNIAFEQFTKAFGRDYYNALAEKIGVKGAKKGFMQLSPNDSAKFLKEIYDYFETDSPYAATMKKAMVNSMHSVIIPPAVKNYECAHKYGWDVDSYHDIAIVYHERPFGVVVMTDLDEGRYQDNAYIQKIVKNLLALHESFTPEIKDGDMTINNEI